MRAVFLFLLFTGSRAFAQEYELLGKYSFNRIISETIEFKGKDSFYFRGFYCTNWVSGKGRCEIRNDRLYLYFEKRPKTDSSYYQLLEMKTSSSSADSMATVQIICVDSAGRKLSNVNIVSGRQGTTSGDDAKAILHIAKNSAPLALTISVNWREEKIKLALPGQYDQYSLRVQLAYPEKFNGAEQWRGLHLSNTRTDRRLYFPKTRRQQRPLQSLPTSSLNMNL